VHDNYCVLQCFVRNISLTNVNTDVVIIRCLSQYHNYCIITQPTQSADEANKDKQHSMHNVISIIMLCNNWTFSTHSSLSNTGTTATYTMFTDDMTIIYAIGKTMFGKLRIFCIQLLSSTVLQLEPLNKVNPHPCGSSLALKLDSLHTESRSNPAIPYSKLSGSICFKPKLLRDSLSPSPRCSDNIQLNIKLAHISQCLESAV